MNIEKLAREAGFSVQRDEFMFRELLARFTALIRAEVLEEAAKVCETLANDRWALYKGRAPYTGYEKQRASDYTQGESDGADHCAAAIRALKDK